MTIYITLEQALATHRSTIEHSGGGDCSDINIGYLESALEMVQNDDYYPSFKDKLVHLVWSVNRNHSFSDGNKRTFNHDRRIVPITEWLSVLYQAIPFGDGEYQLSSCCRKN